jgi:hypothetical protein
MNDTTTSNPREVIGGNNPPLGRSIAAEQGDFALVTTAFLNEEYARQPGIVTALLNEARELPEVIEDDDTKGKVASLIKRLRDTTKALESFREKEKLPYLRGGQAVDQFFFGLEDKLARRDKKAKAGAADVLSNRLTDYDVRILEKIREERRRLAAKEERRALEAQEEASRAAAAAEEARIAAERARKPETAAAKEAVAEVKQEQAGEAKVNAALAIGKAEEAHISTLAKPADIMRMRGEDGTLSTMATEPYAEIENETLLDREKLWPFISLDAKEKALRAWAKTGGYNQQMAGAKIGRRPKSVVR